MVHLAGYVDQLPDVEGLASGWVPATELEQDGALYCEGGLGCTIYPHGYGEDSLALHAKVVEEVDGSHRELCPSVHDCGVVPVPAWFVSVMVEPGQGDTELCICLSVQCDLHRVSGAKVRLSLQPWI